MLFIILSPETVSTKCFCICRIAASLGLAMAFVYQKQAQRAKTILKRVALKATWKFEEAEYLERSWLLMAELYFQSGKTNICVELVNKVLVYNKSSIKGLELLSAVAEKEQKYGILLYFVIISTFNF